MLTAEERMELDVLRKHGAGIREWACYRWSRDTVRRYLREGERQRCANLRRSEPRSSTRSKPTSLIA